MWYNYQREYYRTGSSLFFFVNPDSMQPTLEFFGLESSEDATGIYDAMTDNFQKQDLSSSIQNIIFLSSGGT